MLRVTILYNEPVLPADHPDYASEAGVLESVEAFAAAFEGRHKVTRLGIGRSLAEIVDRLASPAPDVVVNFCEGFAGHCSGEIYVTGLLELLSLPYTGSAPDCLSLVRDKVRTKQVLAASGIATAEHWLVRREEKLERVPQASRMRQRLGEGLLFVKPAAEDASLGIDERSVVDRWDALADKVAEVQSRYGDVLVEQYLDGREFNVGVVALPLPRVLPIAEIEFQIDGQNRWPIVTYAGKWAAESASFRATPVRCPALLDDAAQARVSETALAAFAATGCRDYARVDLRMTADGTVYVLEVNANPDAGPSAGLARALAVGGVEYSEFAEQLVDQAILRKATAARSMHPPAELPAVVHRERDDDASPLQTVHSDSGVAISIRALRQSDRVPLVELLAACQMFRPDEIQVAGEILDEALRDGDAGHYRVLVADVEGAPVGWSCHGRVPLTDATFDLYWIAVHPDYQGRRVGRSLLTEIERLLRVSGARWLLAETSSAPQYEKTCAFYERAGFQVAGTIPDFYRPADGRVTFAKRLLGE